MPEKVTVAYRGAKYEIGRAKRYYGIWVTGAPASDPLDRWPQTPDGWTQAWARYTAMETPGTIAKIEPSRAGLKRAQIKLPRASGSGGPDRVQAGAWLLGLGVLLGIIGLFPAYVEPQSLASQSDQLWPHLIYLAGWALSGALIAFGARRSRGETSRREVARLGALLGAGLSAVTLGLFLADLGEVISGSSSLLGPGLVLTLLGWLACAAGSVLPLTARTRASAATSPVPPSQPTRSGPAKPRADHAGPLALVLLAAIGAVATFVPAWDSFTFTQAANGSVQTETAGNAFSNPGAMIAGDVIVMIAIIAIAVLAGLWRPVRHGAILLAGATVPLIAQAISALIQVSQTPTPGQFGISQAQASALGLSISSGVTPIFWVYCVFVISLVVSCAWMLTAPRYPAMPAVPVTPGPAPQPPVQAVDDEPADSDRDPADSGRHPADSGREPADSDGDAEDDAESSSYTVLQTFDSRQAKKRPRQRTLPGAYP